MWSRARSGWGVGARARARARCSPVRAMPQRAPLAVSGVPCARAGVVVPPWGRRGARPGGPADLVDPPRGVTRGAHAACARCPRGGAGRARRRGRPLTARRCSSQSSGATRSSLWVWGGVGMGRPCLHARVWLEGGGRQKGGNGAVTRAAPGAAATPGEPPTVQQDDPGAAVAVYLVRQVYPVIGLEELCWRHVPGRRP